MLVSKVKATVIVLDATFKYVKLTTKHIYTNSRILLETLPWIWRGKLYLYAVPFKYTPSIPIEQLLSHRICVGDYFSNLTPEEGAGRSSKYKYDGYVINNINVGKTCSCGVSPHG